MTPDKCEATRSRSPGLGIGPGVAAGPRYRFHALKPLDFHADKPLDFHAGKPLHSHAGKPLHSHAGKPLHFPRGKAVTHAADTTDGEQRFVSRWPLTAENLHGNPATKAGGGRS